MTIIPARKTHLADAERRARHELLYSLTAQAKALEGLISKLSADPLILPGALSFQQLTHGALAVERAAAKAQSYADQIKELTLAGMKGGFTDQLKDAVKTHMTFDALQQQLVSAAVPLTPEEEADFEDVLAEQQALADSFDREAGRTLSVIEQPYKPVPESDPADQVISCSNCGAPDAQICGTYAACSQACDEEIQAGLSYEANTDDLELVSDPMPAHRECECCGVKIGDPDRQRFCSGLCADAHAAGF